MKYIKIELKWAVIFAGVSMLWMLLERLAGLHSEHIEEHPVYTNLFAIPAIAIYVLALLDKRKNYYHGYISYKKGLTTGMIMTVIITLFSPITQAVTTYLITPEFFPNAIAYTVETGQMTREAAEASFNFRNYVLIGLIGSFVMGMITTAVVALIVKKDKPTKAN